MSRPKWARSVAGGVRYDTHGRLWIRVKATAPNGRLHDSWRLAESQPAGPRRADRQIAEGAAVVERAERVQAIQLGRGVVETVVHTVGSYAELLHEEKPLRASSRVAWATVSKRWDQFKDTPIAAVTTDDVRSWWRDVRGRYAPATANGTLTQFASVFAHAHSEGLISRDPVASARLTRVRRDKSARPMPEFTNRMDEFFAATMEVDVRAWLSSAFLASTAMRVGELFGPQKRSLGPLPWSQVADDAIEIDSERSKTHSQRLVAVSPFLSDLLDLWPVHFGEDACLVTPGFGYATFFDRFRNAVTLMGLTPGKHHDGSIHDLRVWARTTMRRDGVADVVCDAIAGHSTQVIKAAYDRTTPEEREAALASLGEHVRAVAGWPGVPGTERDCGHDGVHGAPQTSGNTHA